MATVRAGCTFTHCETRLDRDAVKWLRSSSYRVVIGTPRDHSRLGRIVDCPSWIRTQTLGADVEPETNNLTHSSKAPRQVTCGHLE